MFTIEPFTTDNRIKFKPTTTSTLITFKKKNQKKSKENKLAILHLAIFRTKIPYEEPKDKRFLNK